MIFAVAGSGVFAGIFPVLFFVVIAAILAVVLFAAAKSVARSLRRRNAPILTADARVSSVRAAETGVHAAFDLGGGAGLEFDIAAREYGALREGDEGRLTFQGERFVSFFKKTDESGSEAP